MPRFRTLAAVAVAAAAAVLTPVLAFPTPASATSGPILAVADRVALGGDPWTPSGDLTVELRNSAATEQKGSFLLHLPHTVKLGPTSECAPVEGAESIWSCGDDTIPAGGSRTYTLKLTSTIPQPAFEIADEGWVEGRSATGEASRRVEFSILWPGRLPLRLAATSGPVSNGTTDIDVRVTNAGTFTMGGYSLNVTTPTGVTVVSPACSDSGRMNGVGCELYRPGPLKAGATDRFVVRLKVTATPVTVKLFLSPTNRYTNDDTKVSLTLRAAGASTPGGSSNRDGGGSTLPVTGSRTTPILLGIGGALVALGAGILLLVRRRRFVVD